LRRRRWWLFKGELYWEDEGYDEQEMKALLLQRLRQKERRLARALDLMEGRETPGRSRRGFIADELRQQVWRRDRGRCVECGLAEDLQYDHIIPVASGGATTLENLQLLCRSCNAAKGASIA
jgi:5-methylcytosine-specific restriction endonuclease McrA